VPGHPTLRTVAVVPSASTDRYQSSTWARSLHNPVQRTSGCSSEPSRSRSRPAPGRAQRGPRTPCGSGRESRRPGISSPPPARRSTRTSGRSGQLPYSGRSSVLVRVTRK
jgi:hypothetical protein